MVKHNKSRINIWAILFFILLAILIGIVIWLIVRQLRENFQMYDPEIIKIKKKLSLIHPAVNKLEFYASDKSYTINKHKVHLCLRDEHDKYYDDNMLMYVALHELAHVLCDEIGHTEKFSIIFQELLDKAEKIGIYDSSIPPIKDYCNYSS